MSNKSSSTCQISLQVVLYSTPALASLHASVAQAQIQHDNTSIYSNIPVLCAGDHVGALAMSEPGSGSDVVSMRCRADKQDGCYVLNGTKMWCTNGTVANTLVVYARTEQDKGPHGITAFIIEKGMKVLHVHHASSHTARGSSPGSCANVCFGPPLLNCPSAYVHTIGLRSRQARNLSALILPSCVCASTACCMSYDVNQRTIQLCSSFMPAA